MQAELNVRASMHEKESCMLCANIEAAHLKRKAITLSGGQPGWITELIESGKLGPQAFLVEQSPGSVVRPHFHLQNQFQLFLTGDGTFGRKQVGAVQVHYANRHTGYGPIIAGDNGLSYLTLRETRDEGAWYLPESRNALEQAAPKRALTSKPILLSDKSWSFENNETRLIEPAEDGLAAWYVSISATEHARLPVTNFKAGRFCVVIRGSVLINGFELPALSVFFLSPKDPDIAIHATGGPASLIVMQYPTTLSHNATKLLS